MHTKTLTELKAGLQAKDFSARELTEHFLARIERHDGTLNSFVTVTADQALAQADAADQAIAAGDHRLLTGLPIAHKDIFCTEGVRTSCGSRMLDNFIAPYTATVVEKMADQGAIMLGKTNMDEFAMGSSNETSFYGPVRNPWDTERVPGGSSGGAAASLAARLTPGATGTDTGGSIRQPAALCGVVGVKPTYGAVSRYGLVAFASSLDQIGPFARTVSDAALLLEVISGHDPLDSTSIPEAPADLTSVLDRGVEGMRIGIIKELSGDVLEGIAGDVRARLGEAAAALEAAGATVETTSVPSTVYGLSAYYVIAPAEASSNLARYDGVRFGLRVDAATSGEMHTATRTAGFGDEVKRRIMLGTYALSAGYYDAYYGKSQKVRTLIVDDFARAYGRYDLLLSPTSPTTAFSLGEKTADPMTMYLTDVCTIPSNLAGHPSMSVPFGVGDDGMPVGVQVLAPAMGEPAMFRAAAVLEAAAPPGAAA